MSGEDVPLRISLDITEEYVKSKGEPDNFYCIDENNVLWGSGAKDIIATAEQHLREDYTEVALTYVDNVETGWNHYADNPWETEEVRDVLAQAAMQELYTLTGYNVTECVYTTDGRSKFIFGKSKENIKKCIAFYSRDFGSALCGDEVPYMGFMNARRVHYSDIQQLDSPYQKEELSGQGAIPY